MKSFINYNIVKQAFITNGYSFYDNGTYNLNIFGVRNSDLEADVFNDLIGVAYRDKFNRPVVMAFKATTDPGASFLGDKMGNANGTFILKPGQYKGALELGKHKGRYEALVQTALAQFVGWRDNNNDRCLTMLGRLYADVTGLNLHTTSFINEIEKIGACSAGCQVIHDDKEFLIFMAIIKKSAELYGNTFSYTLFEEEDLY